MAQLDSSGLDHATFARRHGVSLSALRSWRYRFRREPTPVAPLRMLVVEPVPRRDDSTVELVVDGCTLRAPAGTDPTWLAAVVVALRRC